MLLLFFKIKDEKFVIDATKVVEVVPYLLPQKIPHAPDYFLGLINYRTKSVPVIDLSQMLENNSSRKLLSTRIIMINFATSPSKSRVLGLLAENVTETTHTPAGWLPPNPDRLVRGTQAIDSSFIDSKTMIQWFSPEQMLPSTAISKIFTETSSDYD